MSRIDDILNNSILQEEPDVPDERTPEERFQFCFLCEIMLGEPKMKQYSRSISHILNLHDIIVDYEIIPWDRHTSISYDDVCGYHPYPEQHTKKVDYIYIPGFSVFFNLSEEKTLDAVWDFVWSISCFNNGLLLHNHSVWKNNWKEDAKAEFNSMYGEDILNTNDIAKLLNVFWPRMFFYEEDLKNLIFRTKHRYELMEFRGFHRVRLNSQWYNTKEELIISGRDAMEIQEKWWFVKTATMAFIKTPIWSVLLEDFEKFLRYLTNEVDGSAKRYKLSNDKNTQRFIDEELNIEEISSGNSLFDISLIKFTEKITIDDDGNVIRLQG